MITINVNKELVKVEHWEDVLARPHFRENLNPKEHELGSILGRYFFEEKVRCGLSDCHTPHTRGYLVATKSGLETNIGQHCGKNYFGVDFVELAAKFDRDMAEKDGRELLWTVRFGLDEIEERIDQLRDSEYGASWVHKNITALRNPAKTPTAITRKFDEMVRQQNGRVTIARQATAEEVEEMEAVRGKRLARPQYIDEVVGTIAGIEAMYGEYDLRELLTIQLEEKIKEFKAVAIDTLQLRELTRWSKWSQTIERNLDSARQSVGYGRLLLTQRNLRQLWPLIDVKARVDLERFDVLLEALPR